MTASAGPSQGEAERQELRLQQMAAEKATLHLVLRLIERLNPLARIEDLLRELLVSIMDTIGGTNIKLYYWEEGELHYQDFQGVQTTLAVLEDPLVLEVAQKRAFIEQEGDPGSSLLREGAVPAACTWGFPLLVGDDLLGVVVLENLHVGSRALGQHLPVFFHHTALILSNELRRRAREAAEEVLRQRTEELDSYFNNALDLFVIADTTGHFRRVNASWEKALGYPAGDLEGARFLDFIHPDDQTPTRAAAEELEAQRPVVNFVNRYRHRDGSWRWIEWRSSARGQTIYAAARDITERRQVEEALRTKDRALEASLNSIAIANLEGRLTWVNPAFLRLWDYPDAAEVLGRPVASFWRSPEQAMQVTATLKAKGSWSGPLQAVTHGGELREVEVSATVIPGEDGAPIGLLAVFQDITERQLTEHALRESEEKFSLAFHSAPMLMTLSLLEPPVFLDVNQAFLRASGYSREEVLGRSPLELGWIAPEDRARILEGLKDGTRVVDLAVVLHAKDGRAVHCLYSGELLSIGGRSCLLGTAQDVTPLVQAQRAMQESEARLQAIFGSSQDAIGVSVAGLHEMVNPAYVAMFGFDRAEDLIGTPIVNLIAPESRATIQDNVRARSEGWPVPAAYEVVAMRRDGSTFRMEVHASAYDRDGIVHTVVSLRDVTEARRAEERLRDSEARYASIAENSPVAIYRFSDRRGGLYYSPRTSDLIGLAPSELMGSPTCWQKAIHPEDQPMVARAIAEALANDTSLDLVYRVRHASGEERWLRDRASCHQQPDGEVIIDGVALDVTAAHRAEEERKRLQTQLLQSQKMESLGSLAGGVAHDMNNVLGAILGLASAQVYAQPEGSLSHRAFETIIKACDRGGKMVKSLLSFARQNPAEERELDLNALLREEVHLLERTTLAKVRLELDLDSGLRPIRGDASALTHTFMNLCVNAVDAMPGGGTLSLRTRNAGDWVEVRVEDTGTGMPRDILEKAFDPFFTTKEPGKGTGLGLSMAYSTVKAHQGRMEIHSEPGRGTQVQMLFPACVGDVAETGPAPRDRAVSGLRSLQVMLVDDDELIQGSVPLILQALGHRVSAAGSGEEALGLLEQGLRPDVIILDMNMPGLGGVGTLPRLRRQLPEVPVLLATGRADPTAHRLVAAHPPAVLLPKPFDLEALQRTLEAVLHGG